MQQSFSGFDWDDGNREKCRKHGVTTREIEELFEGVVTVVPDEAHSAREQRYRAIGKTAEGRHVFVVFTLRFGKSGRRIRPISARFMHRKEIRSYEDENPDL